MKHAPQSTNYTKFKTNNNMKKQWKFCFYAAFVLCMSASCIKEDRTTVVFGTVKDDVNNPIAGADVELNGVKGVFQGRSTFLKTTRTDAKGEYSITAEIPKEFHSGNIDFTPNKITDKYSDFGAKLYLNGNQTKDCCRVPVGQKSQYDLVLLRK